MAHPLPDDALALAAETGDLPVERVDALVTRTADYLRGKERALSRRFERAVTATDGAILLADADFWTRTGVALGFDDAEVAAVRRAHEATLLLAGRRGGRRREFESALEIRTALVLANR